MTKPTFIIWTAFLAASPFVRAEGLDNAEVRIPYGELKQLLARATPATKTETPKPALLSARLTLSIENERPVIDGTFRTTCFSNDVSLIPLIAGDLSLENQEPENAAVVTDGASLCLVSDKADTRTLQPRLLPVQNKNGVKALLPVPPDAQDVTACGEDLVSSAKIRGENRSLAVALVWETRGILDRQVMISSPQEWIGEPSSPKSRRHCPRTQHDSKSRMLIMNPCQPDTPPASSDSVCAATRSLKTSKRRNPLMRSGRAADILDRCPGKPPDS